MKHLSVLVLIILLTGCTTSITEKQEVCETQYTSFEDVARCTKETFTVNPMVRASDTLPVRFCSINTFRRVINHYLKEQT